MRFKSPLVNGYRVFAVTGTNTVSFAIDFSGANTRGLLGFAVERIDPAARARFFMRGFKVFPSVVPHPTSDTVASTFEHPVQSFVWDDFTAEPAHAYTYVFHPLKGRPNNLDRSAPVIKIDVRTEPLFDARATHQVFFNRGVASSQFYAREFSNERPDKLAPAKRAKALQWLSRELDDAILKFIASAARGDTLLGCFYEFRYKPVAQALADARARGVNVQIIVDGKVNKFKDKQGKIHESFPREDNRDMIRAVHLPRASVKLREARTSAIAHNKFMVLLRGARRAPAEVWTGSTNLSEGGIFGQTNVGHWVRDRNVTARFAAYWDLLRGDPGGKEGDSPTVVRQKNAQLRQAVEGLQAVPADWRQVPAGITAVFSPRTGTEVLDMYVKMVDEATDLSCITLAFGINKAFKEQLKDNTPLSHLAFFLLEKRESRNRNSRQPFIAINSKQNVYMAWGSFLREPLQQWARETNNRALEFNTHVAFIHSKFLLKDPLGTDPIVVTGSANFSDDSQKENDENMIIIRGDQRVADIYFTEFNRLFNHYYFRSVTEAAHRPQGAPDPENSLQLMEGDQWLDKYKRGKLRFKRVEMFKRMRGFA